MVKTTLPDTSVTTYGYDRVGNVVSLEMPCSGNGLSVVVEPPGAFD